MLLANVATLRAGLVRGQRLLGLDPGAKVIGVALSDVGLMIASPFGTIARGKLAANAEQVARIAASQGAGGVVVGFPLSLDGSVGPAAQGVRDWAMALAAAANLNLALWDERLSSSAVNRMLVTEMDLTRRRRAAVVDKAAAAYMLQAALDATR